MNDANHARSATRNGRTYLDHDKVILDDTVANEASHGGDGLDGDIELSRGVGLILGLSDSVHLLVESDRESNASINVSRSTGE